MEESGKKMSVLLREVATVKFELGKKKNLLKTYSRALPDKGAKLKNQIDDLQIALGKLNLELENVNDSKKHDGSANCDGKIETSLSSKIEKNENEKNMAYTSQYDESTNCDFKIKTGLSSKTEKSENVSTCTPQNNEPLNCDGEIETGSSLKTEDSEKVTVCTPQHDKAANCDGKIETNLSTKSEKSVKDMACTSQSNLGSLTFAELAKKAPGVESNLPKSPAFTSWRGNKTKLTEAKPLHTHTIGSSYNKLGTYSNAKPSASEETISKLHRTLVTYPNDNAVADEPDNLKTNLMLHQRKGLAWLLWRESQDPSGGILADDMGLGKTLTMISLILKQIELNNFYAIDNGNYECRGTLIICVASIIHQWKEEIKKHCEDGFLKILIYHGSSRETNIKVIMEHNIVITTYNIVLAEWKKLNNGQESPLHKFKWERIILDEAHTIKNHSSKTAQAIFALKAFRKWGVTGTPIHNEFKDVYSLVKFLGVSPFDNLKIFNELTSEKSENSKERKCLLVKSIVLRRTKTEVDESGKPLIDMTNKTISLCYFDLSKEERAIYDKLNEKISMKINQYFGPNSKKINSANLLVLLLRLQQCCSHISLLGLELDDSSSVDSECVLNRLSSLSIGDSSRNSSCSNLDITFSEFQSDNLSDFSAESSKVKKMLSKLKKIIKSSETDKIVIVSQWVSMLDVISYHLQQEDVKYYIIAGNTKSEDRQKAAEDFNNNFDKDCVRVILLSLKAGGVGLNLVGANHLFLLDLHWNPALEMQACDRIHRVGQKKDVHIYKFVCRNTIEEKIKSLQDQKRCMATNALHRSKQDMKGLTMDDLKLLFNVDRK